jgi:hypothetical protein
MERSLTPSTGARGPFVESEMLRLFGALVPSVAVDQSEVQLRLAIWRHVGARLTSAPAATHPHQHPALTAFLHWGCESRRAQDHTQLPMPGFTPRMRSGSALEADAIARPNANRARTHSGA